MIPLLHTTLIHSIEFFNVLLYFYISIWSLNSDCWIFVGEFYVDESQVKYIFFIFEHVILYMPYVVLHLNNSFYFFNFKDYLDQTTTFFSHRSVSLTFMFETHCKRMSPPSHAIAPLLMQRNWHFQTKLLSYFTFSCRRCPYRYV